MSELAVGDELELDACFRALWLAERASACTDSAGTRVADTAGLEEWAHHSGFSSIERLFEYRGVDLERFRHASPRALDARLQPVDPQVIAEGSTFGGCGGGGNHAGDDPPGAGAGAELFLPVLRPWLQRARSQAIVQLQTLIGKRVAGLELPAAVALASKSIEHRLQRLVSRAMAVELARFRQAGRLVGETPRERFESFIRNMATTEAMNAFRCRYPVLWRQMHDTLVRSVEVTVELLTRLAVDLPELGAAFGASGTTLRLVDISAPLGDPHDGRDVHLFEFAGGLKVVYKPRPLEAEALYARVVAVLEDEGLGLSLRTPCLLTRPEYGWMEFVEAGDCADQAAVDRYFERLGAAIAVLHLLQATDLHHENLIAAGEQPMFIDLESICTPVACHSGTQHSSDLTVETLIRTGLLPRLVAGHGDDMCGLAATSPAASEHRAWLDAGTDRMRIGMQTMHIEPLPNLPRLAGRRVSAFHGRAAIDRGFAHAYRMILRCRERLEAGPLADIEQARFRWLLRPTMVYYSLLDAARHPTVAQDALSAERLFDRLWRFMVDVPGIAKVVGYEQACLRKGDVPRLEHDAGRDGLVLDGVPVPGFFQAPGAVRVRDRLALLSEADLACHRHILSMGLFAARAADEVPDVAPRRPPPDLPWRPDAALDRAIAIGDRLLTLAIRDRFQTGWIGLILGPDLRWYPASLNGDLYDGLAGIGLFMLELARHCAEPRFVEAACEVAATLEYRAAWTPAERTVGAFQGLAGEALFLAAFAAQTGDARAGIVARERLERIRAVVAHDRQLDVIGGSAGAVLALRAIDCYLPALGGCSLARELGEHLLRHAQPVAGGWGWGGSASGGVPLTGLGHGASGAVLAFAELYRWDGNPVWADATRAGLAFERSCFDAAAAVWPDQRADRHGGAFSAWCHGAAGIGMTRARLLGLGIEPEAAYVELGHALQATRQEGFGQNPCLCHGDFGNIELWLLAARFDEQARGELPRLSARLLGELEHHWDEMVEQQAHPGLMGGIAGIGYQLLRMRSPHLTPSILTLQSVADRGSP